MGYVTGIYVVTFAGSLAGLPQSLITCSDSAVSIVEVTVGGNAPTLSINAGGPIILGNWVWGETSPGFPYAFCPLPQSAPAVQTFIVNMIPVVTIRISGTGLTSTIPRCPAARSSGGHSGLTMSFACTELPAGTYQFAATYPNTSFTQNGTPYQPSTATQFLVQDASGDTLATYSVDQTQAPSDYESEGHSWKILGSITTEVRGTLTLVMTTIGQSAATGGATQIVAILDAIRINRTSSDISRCVIGPDDVVTLDIPANWMTT